MKIVIACLVSVAFLSGCASMEDLHKEGSYRHDLCGNGHKFMVKLYPKK